MTDAIDAARERMGAASFSDWEPRDVTELVRLMSKFSDSLTAAPE